MHLLASFVFFSQYVCLCSVCLSRCCLLVTVTIVCLNLSFVTCLPVSLYVSTSASLCLYVCVSCSLSLTLPSSVCMSACLSVLVSLSFYLSPVHSLYVSASILSVSVVVSLSFCLSVSLSRFCSPSLSLSLPLSLCLSLTLEPSYPSLPFVAFKTLTHSSWHVYVDVASRTIRLNTSLFWASLPASVGLISSHSLMSSVHLLVGRPFLLLPSSLASNYVLF